MMKKRILVVDDDSLNLARTKMILGEDYVVFMAESGMEALKKLRNEEIDMVLLDIDMPKMNGIETFERRRRRSQRNQIGRRELSEKALPSAGAAQAGRPGA